MTQETTLKIVRVHWLDHNSTNGWKSFSQVEIRGYRVESVGWLMGENDEALLLATSIGEGKAADFLCILKACITDRWEL